MCGIFGYVNYLVERDRKFILETLLTGLSRLEYRGYDSAGIACDGDKEGEVFHHFYHQKRTILTNQFSTLVICHQASGKSKCFTPKD